MTCYIASTKNSLIRKTMQDKFSRVIFAFHEN